MPNKWSWKGNWKMLLFTGAKCPATMGVVASVDFVSGTKPGLDH